MNYLCTQPPRMSGSNGSSAAPGLAAAPTTCRHFRVILTPFFVTAVNRQARQRAFLNLERDLFVTNSAPFFACISLFEKLWIVFNQRLPRLSILDGLLLTCYARCQ